MYATERRRHQDWYQCEKDEDNGHRRKKTIKGLTNEEANRRKDKHPLHRQPVNLEESHEKTAKIFVKNQ